MIYVIIAGFKDIINPNYISVSQCAYSVDFFSNNEFENSKKVTTWGKVILSSPHFQQKRAGWSRSLQSNHIKLFTTILGKNLEEEATTTLVLKLIKRAFTTIPLLFFSIVPVNTYPISTTL